MKLFAAALSATLAMGAPQAQPPAQTPPSQQTPAPQTPPTQAPAQPAAPETVKTEPRVSNDPRVNLKPGLRDAGQAIKHMELVAAVAKPSGFEPPPAPPPPAPSADAPAAGPGRGGNLASSLDFANSDLAFRKADMFLGNFHGFNTYDIESPKKPRVLASVVCPGGQGDMSVHGNLLFMSVEQTRGRLDCGTQGVKETVSAERFRGIRIFDISDIGKPKQIAAIQTCRGSHTHTLIVDPKDKANIYVYGSGTSSVRSAEELAGCSGEMPDKDPNTALFSIDVIQVPLASPEKAKIVNRPRIFADEKTGKISGLHQGGNFGPGTQSSRMTNQCHDITVMPEAGLAAGACSGNGILLDISDPVNPKRLDAVTDKNFAYWHSATFNNDGTKILFTDEWGGGTSPRCRATDLLEWGADAVFDIVDGKLQFRSYYKMPAPQTDQENCVAHNGSIIPVPGRDIMVQAWYQGGLSVFDFTDSAHPVEIAYFDRGPIDPQKLVIGGYWSTYWYNGRIYGSEIARGVDIFRLLPSEYLSQNEIDAASSIRMDEFNAQHQPKIVYPPTVTVARAYLDQLTRSNGISAARAAAVKKALGGADKDKPGKSAIEQLDAVAKQLDADAAAASGLDAKRLKALAETMRGRAARARG
jgi:hypothetical protein